MTPHDPDLDPLKRHILLKQAYYTEMSETLGCITILLISGLQLFNSSGDIDFRPRAMKEMN
jgi:hypothetical protein